MEFQRTLYIVGVMSSWFAGKLPWPMEKAKPILVIGSFPLAYEVFAGNRANVTTVEEIVRVMESKYGRARRVWVMDRGMVSEDNLQFLRDRGGLYLVGTPRGMLKKFQAYLLDSDWSQVQEGVEVRLINSPDDETFVLCRSSDRREKEKAIHERFAKRIEAGLGKLDRELKQAHRKRDRAVLERRIGRLLGRNSRAAGGFKIELLEDKTCQAGLKLCWSCVQAWRQWARLSEGCQGLATHNAMNACIPAYELDRFCICLQRSS